jgi:SAM-dependent methyltransferase
VLDAGCGLGHLRHAVREVFPRARYVGLETSDYLCRRYGWVKGSIAGYAPRESFDLVFCHDVLQYLDDRTAVRALANLGRLCQGALYFSVLTPGTGAVTPTAVGPTATVSAFAPHPGTSPVLARQFRPLGGGLLARRGYDPLLWELEKPWS